MQLLKMFRPGVEESIRQDSAFTIGRKFSKRRALCYFGAVLTLVSVVMTNTLSLVHEGSGIRSADAPLLDDSLLNPRIAIVQYFGGSSNKAPGFRSARNVLIRYAEMHGYAYYALEENDVALSVDVLRELQTSRSTKQHNWRRPFFLSQIIETGRHEWLAYFDTDIVITDPTRRLEDWTDGWLLKDKDLIIANAPDGINNGVFFQRATNWSLNFNSIWWEQRSRKSMLIGDNWPFMAALLISWSTSNRQKYDNQCSMAVHPQMESWPTFFECYREKLAALWAKRTHASDCRNASSSCGSALPSDEHIAAVWELNKGLGFQGENAWTPGSFLIHFAGKGFAERDRLLLEFSNRTADVYFQVVVKPKEGTLERKRHDER